MPTRFFQFALKYLHVLFTLSRVASAFAQQPDVQSEAEAEAFIEALEDLDGLRINVNRATERDLLALPGLTPDLAWRIAAFRPYNTLKDLNRVPGLSAEHLDALTPHLSLTSQKRWTGRSTARISHSAAQKSPRLYQRHEFGLSDRVAGHILTERDPGESAWNDLITGHLQINAAFAHLTLGDLRPEFGQGLLFSRRTRSATGLSWATPRSSARAGNRSADEAGILRGALISHTSSWFSLTVLFARARWDADTDRDGIYRVYRSGLHDTDTARNRKGTLRERLAAFRLSFGNPNRTIGLTALGARFSPQRPAAADAHQIALDTRWHTNRFTCFGETAFSPQDYACLLGGVFRFPDFRLHLIARRYGPQFHSLRGGAFATYGAPPNNEWGIFAGAAWRFTARTRLELSLDRHGRIVPQNAFLPERGERVRVSLHRRLARKIRLRIAADQSAASDRLTRRSLRIDLTREGLTLWAACNQSGVFARASGARLQVGRAKRLSLSLWATRFSVPDYDARLYAFEPDVWGGGRLVVLNGKGHTAGVRFTCTLGPLSLAARYGLKHTADAAQSAWGLQLDLQR